ncbi:atp4 subunit B of the stator stalk of mitochondrial F1F0 ATP synthase, partial [Entophlyctis sp. JEL0112]
MRLALGLLHPFPCPSPAADARLPAARRPVLARARLLPGAIAGTSGGAQIRRRRRPQVFAVCAAPKLADLPVIPARPGPARPVVSARNYSTEKAAEPNPTAQAQSLINLFPGESLAAKAFSVLFSSSIAAYLISKEVYILDGEMFEVLTMFGAYYLWYQGGKEGFVEYFSERQNTMRNILTAAREQHKAVVKERMDHIG